MDGLLRALALAACAYIAWYAVYGEHEQFKYALKLVYYLVAAGEAARFLHFAHHEAPPLPRHGA